MQIILCRNSGSPAQEEEVKEGFVLKFTPQLKYIKRPARFALQGVNIIVPKKKVNRYIKSDASYLGENEITIDDKAIEIKNIPAEKETGVVCVYPYSVISIIYETENYFYFIVANEVKILPKRVIPQAMSQSVFNAINRNPNRMYVK